MYLGLLEEKKNVFGAAINSGVSGYSLVLTSFTCKIIIIISTGTGGD